MGVSAPVVGVGVCTSMGVGGVGDGVGGGSPNLQHNVLYCMYCNYSNTGTVSQCILL